MQGYHLYSANRSKKSCGMDDNWSFKIFERPIQGGHDTGKTGNLAVNFSRQGKHREFSKFNFYTEKTVATQGKF